MPSKFIHKDCELADPTEIANAFNSYFANIDKKLFSKIEHDDITVVAKRIRTYCYFIKKRRNESEMAKQITKNS